MCLKSLIFAINFDAVVLGAVVVKWVRHISLNTRVMRSNHASVTAGGVPVSSASSRWDRLRQNG